MALQLSDLEKWWGIQVSRLTIISIIFGGGFATREYLDHKSDVAVMQSLQLISRFSEDPLLDDKIKTDRAWDDVFSGLSELVKVDSSPASYEGFVIGFVESKELTNSIYRIFDLYEEAVICVEAQLCDKQVIDKYLLDSGRNFFSAFYPIVCNQRARWRDYSIYSTVQTYYSPRTINTVCPAPSLSRSS